MDIAYYLSELLEQLGKVNVPGLGSFTRVKVDGYYNSDEGRVYPPTSKLEFTQQYADDDVLTQYIGVKKRISLASSKYFTEKYITGLKQEVIGREIPFADLGTLYFSNGRIQFKPAQTVSDPEFYGYPAISLNKKNAAPAYHYEEPVAEPVVIPEPEIEDERNTPAYEPFTEDDHLYKSVSVSEPEIKAEQENEEYIHPEERGQVGSVVVMHKDYFALQEITVPLIEKRDNYVPYKELEAETEAESYQEEFEEDEPRNLKWLWISLIILFVASGGIFGWLYYQQQQAVPVKKAKTPPVVAHKDTIDSASTIPTAKDTARAANGGKVTPVQNTPTSTIDSTKKRYEIIAAEPKSQKEADKVIKNFQSIGIAAHVVKDAPGKRKKISLGTYDTEGGVTSAMNDLIKSGKVNKDIWQLQINPKK